MGRLVWFPMDAMARDSLHSNAPSTARTGKKAAPYRQDQSNSFFERTQVPVRVY